MKTIKQLSEELRLTKVGLSKAIEREGLKDRLQQQRNTYLIDEELEADIRAIFDHREPKHRQAEQNTNKEQEPTQSEIIAILREELRNKEREIERLHEKIDKQLEEIARQDELQLQLIMQNKRLLEGGTDIINANAEVSEAVSEAEEEAEPLHREQESKGLFARLFR